MDPNGRGDHNQVQAAAGRAVGGGPPSSATASASAASSFLPPPAPLAVDAAVQPRAADSEDPTPPPASATATATGVNNPPSDDEMENIGRDDSAPVPPVQTDAEYEEMENAIRRSVAQTQSEDVPLPLSQIAALVDVERGDAETDAKKKPAPTTERDDDTPPTPPAASLPHVRDEAVPTPTPRQQPIIVRLPPQSMLPSPDEDTVTPSAPVPAPPTEPSPPVLRATLVEDRPEAIVVPDLPVYDAVQIPEQTWMKKYKKYIIVGLGVFFGGAAVAAGVAVSPNEVVERVVLSTARPSESSSPSDVPSWRPTHQPSDVPSLRLTLRPSQSSAPSTHPSESSSPSDVPSWRPTHQPSDVPSLRPTLRPSQSSAPSTHPSQSGKPSTKPTLLPSSPPSTYWSSLSWSRQDLGFNGDASFDSFGLAVAFSADASTMAIGAPGPWGVDEKPGYVKVYGREGEGSSWEQRGDTIHGEANGDQFGRSLALSEDGTTLSVRAPLHDSVGPDSGQVKVYEWDKAALDYVQIGDTLYGAASGDRFGWSLDITNGKILAVGADESDANGQVMIYAWDESSSNFQQRGEAINGDVAEDWFGHSISLAENSQKLAVGAPRNNDSNGNDPGQVRVFEWDEATLTYEQLGDSLLGDADGDRFGLSVSFSRDGTALAVGAPSNSENCPFSGQVQVFVWDEASSNFAQIGQSLYGKVAFDLFGWSLALSSEGKTLAIGAPGIQFGYVEVYGWDEAASEYKLLGQSLGDDTFGTKIGWALALAGNGKDLAIGAPDNDRNGTNSGQVEVFNI